MSSAASLEAFRRTYGDWTSHSIHLGDGIYTLPPTADGPASPYCAVNLRPSKEII
jgi:hypothetical protein